MNHGFPGPGGISIFALLILLVFGGAFLIAAVKRPALLAWLAAVAVGLALIAFILVATVSVRTSNNSEINQSVQSQTFPANEWNQGNIHTTVQMQRAPLYVTWGKFGVIGIAVVGLVMLGSLLSAGRKRREDAANGWHEEPRRGGWGLPVALAGLGIPVFLVFGLFWFRASGSVQMVRREQERATQAIRSEQDRVRLQIQQQTDQIRSKAGQFKDRATQNFDRMINEYEKPRIELSVPSIPTQSKLKVEAPKVSEPGKKMSYAEAVQLIDGSPAQKPAGNPDEGESESAAAAQDATEIHVTQPRSENTVQAEAAEGSHAATTEQLSTPIAAANEVATSAPAAAPKSILQIHFNQALLQRSGVTFSHATLAFLNQRSDKTGPIRIDDSKLLVEIYAASEDTARIGEMRVSKPRGAEIKLSELTDSTKTFSGTLEDSTTRQDRPSWVDQTPNQNGERWRQVIAAGEFLTPAECRSRTNDLLCSVVLNRLESLTQIATSPTRLTYDETERANGSVWNTGEQDKNALNCFGINLEYIRRNIVAHEAESNGEFWETADRSVGPMKTLYTLTEFRPEIDNELRNRWVQYAQRGRITAMSIAGSLCLGAIGLLYGLLKVDTMTKGYYTKRIFFGVGAIGVIVGISVLLALFKSGAI